MNTAVQSAPVRAPAINMSDIYNGRLSADLQSSRFLVDLAMRRVFAAAFPGTKPGSTFAVADILNPDALQADSIQARTARGFRCRLLDYLVDTDLLSLTPGGIVRCEAQLEASLQDRAREREILEGDMRFAALREALAVIEDGAAALLSGEDGLRLLQRVLGPARAQALWERLTLHLPQRFVDRTMGARMLTARLRAQQGRAAIIECGAGIGAVLRRALELNEFDECIDRIDRYVYTDVNAFLVEWGRTWFQSHAPRALFERMEFAVVDLDSSSLTDRMHSADIIVLDDVAHDVIDLHGTLSKLRSALKPGGWLALTEHFRQRPRDFFHFEFLPITLHSYNRGTLDPPRRINRGFMTLTEWSASLAAAGFEHWTIFPDVEVHARWPTGGIVAIR